MKRFNSLIQSIYPNVKDIRHFDTGATESTFKILLEETWYVIKIGNIDEQIYMRISPILHSKGVLVPRVIDIGNYEDTKYVLLEYIDGHNLSTDVSDGVFERLAKMMLDIHSIEGSGYGKMKKEGLNGEYDNFSKYVRKQFLKNVNYDENNLTYHLERIEDYLKAEGNTVFCHMDFSLNNILVKDDNLYLIDYGKEAGFNNPLFDIAKAIVNDSRYGIEVFNIYCDINQCNRDVIRSFLYVIGMRKIRSWGKRGKEGRILKLQELFRDIRFE